MKPAVLLLAAALSLRAATPLPGREITATNLDAYFRSETRNLTERCLTSLPSAAEWRSAMPRYRQQLAEMLGLFPEPERGDLKATVTGRIEDDTFTVENLHFQSRPGLYVTANLYVPKGLTKPAPAVLYVCGHSPVVTNGVSYGSKYAYQHHGIWFARNGYVCLVVDTLQLGEIQGLHHGTYRAGMWWWNARGYTPAGVEAWNGMRALDYLSTRPEVDTNRFAVTGRSGGGAYSWFITALDERIKAAAPVAGITDLENYVSDGCVEGHCDCMFFVNTYRWDYPMLAALAAPRPLLLCNTDADTIFPLDGVVRLHAKTRRVYELLGSETNLGLVITPGPHKDTQELQVPVMRWFNKHLKNDLAVIENAAQPRFAPEQLRVFKQLPADALNTNIHDTFVATAAAPTLTDEVASRRWLALVQEKCFDGWPEHVLPARLERVALKPNTDAKREHYEIESQPNVRLQLDLIHARIGREREFVLRIAGTNTPPLEAGTNAVAANLYVRGIGSNAWPGDAKKQVQIRRRFMLLGQTVDGMRVWDIRRAIQAIKGSKQFGKLTLRIEVEGSMAVNAAMALKFEGGTEAHLTELPKTPNESPDYLNFLRIGAPAVIPVADRKDT